MSHFRKKPVVVAATQWFKNGDHPDDGNEVFPEKGAVGTDPRYTGEFAGQRLEGKMVRYFRRPDVSGESKCQHCGQTMHVHGWIDTLEGGHIVCPGDWIITGVQGERYPCKPDIFAATYEPVDRPDPYLVAVNFSARLLWKTPPETSVELLRREELQERLDYAAPRKRMVEDGRVEVGIHLGAI